MFCSLSAGARLARVSLGKQFKLHKSLWMSKINLQGFENQSFQTPSRRIKRHHRCSISAVRLSPLLSHWSRGAGAWQSDLDYLPASRTATG